MAKLTLTLDTEAKTLSVDVDGTTVDDVTEVSVTDWGGEDDPRPSFSITCCDEDNGVHRMTRLMARGSREAGEEARLGRILRPSRGVAGLVEADARTRAQGQIAAWFQSTRR